MTTDAYRIDLLLALDRARLQLARLGARADMREPAGDGMRALETAKAGAFLAEVAEVADALMVDLANIIDNHLTAFAAVELAQAERSYKNGSAVLIDALRQVARSYGLDSHETLRKRYREPE